LSSFWLTLKQQWTIKISFPLFSILSLAAILVGSQNHRTQFWKGAPRFSKRYQYNNMPLIMLKYNGNLPSSDNTAMLVVLLCTPRMNLQNFQCI
jgi:hypothetical protein